MKYVFLIAVGTLGLYLLLQPQEKPRAPLSTELPVSISELGRKKLGEIRARVRTVPEDRDALIDKTGAVFKEMHELRTYAFREEVRARLMDDLLQDSKSIPLAKRILIDHDFALNAYKGDQAVARVYAIALLEHHAKTAGAFELLDTAQKLAIALSETGDVSRGRAQDLDDLVYAYAKMEDAAILSANLPNLAQHFELNEHTRGPIRNGLFYALKGQLGEGETRERINSAFAGSVQDEVEAARICVDCSDR